MEIVPDLAACAFGARLMAAHLDSFTRQVEGARQARDIEHVHQLRVFSRRLRSALPLFAACLPPKKGRRWLKQVKAITTALGAARDLDVQIDFLEKQLASLTEQKYAVGIRRLALRLQQQREQAQPGVAAALERIETSGTLAQMADYFALYLTSGESGSPHSPALFQLASQAIRLAWDALAACEPYIDRPENVRELHEMRIAAKKLRYTIEIFSPIYPGELKRAYRAIRQSQERLGTIHDMDVWMELIPRFIEQETGRVLDFYGSTTPVRRLLPGLWYFTDIVRTLRGQAYTQFLEEWSAWKQAGIWNDLLQTVSIPSGSANHSPPGGEIPSGAPAGLSGCAGSLELA